MALKYDKPLIPLDLKKVFSIVIHHPAAKFASSETIHKWHKERWGTGAGYNEYIRKDGSFEIMRGDHIGAHTLNMNSKTYGICVEGDYDVEYVMPQAQMNTLLERLRYHIDRMPNKVTVEKHSKYSDTSCPGRYFPFDMVLHGLVNSLEMAVQKLTKNGVIISPDYWLKNAKAGNTVSGEYVAKLIMNFANKM